MRVRRRGTTDRKIYPYRTYNQAGYAKVREPYHVLALGEGTVYEHRFVYYNKHGNGPFDCHWCGKYITWPTMHIDHLDDDKSNNSIDNLVPSCPICNQARGKDKQTATMRERHATKLTHNGVTKTVKEWADDLGVGRTAIKSRLKQGWTVERAVTEPRGKTGPQRRV